MECDSYLDTESTNILLVPVLKNRNSYEHNYQQKRAISCSEVMKWVSLVDKCELPRFKAKCIQNVAEYWKVRYCTGQYVTAGFVNTLSDVDSLVS